MKRFLFSITHTLNHQTAFILFILFLNCLLFALSKQGFDVVDEGWYLSFYQQFFNHPKTVEYNFAYYNTGIIGGLFYKLFPNGGVLVFRLLTILCIDVILIVSYSILKTQISNKIIFLGLAAAVFVTEFGHLAFYYNHLSSLLALVSIWLLLKGLHNNKWVFICLSGTLLAINVFSRIPNVILIGFGLIIPFQLVINSKANKLNILKQLAIYVLGLLLGLTFMWFILHVMGHMEIMMIAIENIFEKGQSKTGIHGGFTLLKNYAANYTAVFKTLVKIGIIYVVLFFIYKCVSHNKLLKWVVFTLSACAFAFLFRNIAIYAVYSLSLFVLALLFISKTTSYKLKNTTVLALLMMILLPIGSEGGIHNVGYMSVWLAFPLTLYGLENLGIIWPLKSFKLIVNKGFYKYIVLSLLIGYFTIKTYNLWHNAYFDPGSRLHKTYPIKNHLTKGIYTTQKRAQIINELLENLKKYVAPNDYVLAFDKIPMVNFLTKTKPYAFNSWPWVYDANMFSKKLNRAQKEFDKLPVVVAQKFETIRTFSAPIPNYLSENKENSHRYNRNKTKVFNNFLKTYNYQLVWSNSYFNIYQTTQNKKANY